MKSAGRERSDTIGVLRFSVFSLLLFSGLSLILSCTPSADSEPSENAVSDIPDIPAPVFSQDELVRLEELRARGGLKVATSEWENIVTKNNDGTYEGFHYQLIQSVSEILDMPVELEFVQFSEFFSRDGLIPDDVFDDPDFSYRPDIFERADILVYDISGLPWREKLMDFVPILPVRMLVIGRTDDPMVQVTDLQGKRAVVYAGTSHETYLRYLNRIYRTGIDIIAVPHGEDLESYINQDSADFCIRDAVGVFDRISVYPELSVSFALGQSLDNSWAVAEGDIHLQQILEKTLKYIRSQGLARTFFRENYGLSIDEYFGLINFRPENKLDLSPEETLYLESVALRGGLRAAIDAEQSVYETDENGYPFGLHYNLAIAVGELLDIPVSFEPVNFRDFFAKDGEVDPRLKSDPDFVYKPDLLNRSDIYIATMSPVKWRKKFLRFIELYPTRLVYMTRTDSDLMSRSDPDDWTFSILEDTSYEIWLADNLNLNHSQIMYSETGLDQARMVSTGEVDATISDANLALTRFWTYPNLTFHPASDEIDNLSWAVASDNILLAGILEKAVGHLKADRTFNRYWKAYYGISFPEYLNLISVQVPE